MLMLFIRRFSIILALTYLLLPLCAQAQVITDLAGRQVDLPEKIDRILLGESRYIPALGILQPDDPLRQIVGMLPDFKLADPAGYQQYQQQFPHIDAIPLIGRSARDSFSVEQAIALDADVAVFGLEGHGPTSKDSRLIEQLKQAGVTVVFVDFRQEPIKNTPTSITILGQVLGQMERASTFNKFYQQQLDAIEQRLQTLPAGKRTKVFLHSRVGLGSTCCETMVNGMMGHFIDWLAADNIATEYVPGTAGIINREYLLINQPDVYIATAIGSVNTLTDSPQFIALGAGVSHELAQQSFQHNLSAPWLAQLDAVKQKRAFAIWHHFYNSPLNIAALQAFAKWLYPNAFNDLNPDTTLEEIYRRFQPIELNGTYWVGTN
ncbi:ABC transporter substrate-binding protein [Methylophaga thiooxydans]|nr:ABC transporter substrate-binding protein [Methylophaga thiooxydans]